MGSTLKGVVGTQGGALSRYLKPFAIALAVAMTILGGALALNVVRDPSGEDARAANGRGDVQTAPVRAPFHGASTRPGAANRLRKVEQISPKQWAARREAFFAQLGKELDLSPVTVKGGLRAVLEARLERRLRNGKITPAQRAAYLEAFDAGVPGVAAVGIPFVVGAPRVLRRFRHRGPRAGLERRRPRLKRTLRRLGKELDRSPADVRRGVRTVFSRRLAAEVKAGRLADATRDEMLQRFDRRTR
jgi:hypothetical protein